MRRKEPDAQALVRRDLARRALRDELDEWRRSASSPEYARFRLALLRDVLSQNLRPFEVAALLEAASRPEVSPYEIAAYKRMGTQWERWV